MTRAAKAYDHTDPAPREHKTVAATGKPRHKHKARKISLGLIIFVLAVLLGARIYLPFYVTDHVNKTLNNIPGYTGSISDVDIALFRGAYVIHDLKLMKKVKDIPVPFLDIQKTDLSIQWGALFKGRVVGDVTLYDPVINFAVGKSGRTEQTGTDTDWTKPIKDLMPLDVNFVEIDDGKITYKNFFTTPQVDIYINNLNGRVTNLRNADAKSDTLPSDINVSGNSIGGGTLKINGKINIIKKIPDLAVTGKLESVDLPALNNYADAFAGIDFNSGNFNLYTDINVKDGNVTGFVKPLLRNIDLIDTKKDKGLHYLWESVVSVVLEIFTNHSNDQVATQIALEGNINNPQTDFWSTLGGILHNAFVKAYSNTTKKE